MQMSLTSKSQPVQWTENPNVLLLATGILLGLTFPLAKIAGQEGIPATSWVMMSSFGVCIALLPALFFSGNLALPNKQHIKYLTLSGPVTFAAPNLLIFLVIPHVGAGYSGIMFALSPIMTAIFSYFLGINTLNRLHIAGITIGLSGALSMSLSRGLNMPQTSYVWLLLALMIPFLLATGNIYRTLAWPSNASPDSLAFWSHAIAFSVNFVLTLFIGKDFLMGIFEYNPMLILFQLVLAGLMAPLLYRLQHHGGPVTLSQIGYIAATVNLVIVTLFLGERYPIQNWVSACVIIIGIALTIKANKLATRQN